MEIIVPVPPGLEGLESLKAEFPNVVSPIAENAEVRKGEKGTREHHDVLRARGLSVARGGIVALIEDHGCPDRNWSRKIVEKHNSEFAAVGGAIENGVNRLLNWAVYFCDFYRYQNPVSEGESEFLSDANVSYKRAALESIRTLVEKKFHEPSVNQALKSQGDILAISPEIVLVQHRHNLALRKALKERYIWGRSYAAARSKSQTSGRRMVYTLLSPLLPGLVVPRMGLSVLKKRRLIGCFLKSLPLTVALVSCWSLGESVGYATGRVRLG